VTCAKGWAKTDDAPRRKARKAAETAGMVVLDLKETLI
jgi:hypothetical protein